MNNFKVKIDKAALIAELGSSENSKPIKRVLEKTVEDKVEDSKKDMLKDFNEHPVSKEIKAGPLASNSSSTLGGYGNLFSFIGFEAGADPIEEVNKQLSQPTRVKAKSSIFRNGRFKVQTNIPTQESLEQSGKIPWSTGLSWLQGIENGISGLGRFLFKRSGSSSSRSKTGIQTNVEKGRSFKPTNYLSKIYKDFFNRIEK